MTTIINFLESEKIKFDIIKNQIIIKRNDVFFELKKLIEKNNLKFMYLDTIFIIF